MGAHIRAHASGGPAWSTVRSGEADRLARGPAVHQDGLGVDQPPERPSLAAPSRVSPSSAASSAAFAGSAPAGGAQSTWVTGTPSRSSIGGEALEPDIDHARPALEDARSRRDHVVSVRSAFITRSGPAMHAAARAAWALDGSTQAPARSSRAI